jgi:hypothetical protein
VTHEVEELERRGWAALSGADGAAFYDDLMADAGLMVFPGLTLDKSATIRAIRAERPWATFRLDDVRVIETGDAAVVTYHAASQRSGQDEVPCAHVQPVRQDRRAVAVAPPPAAGARSDLIG